MIPPPPVVAIIAEFVTTSISQGVYGTCVMCGHCTWLWWDLTYCDLPPVTDRTGTLTDQVPLHPSCVPALFTHWATLSAPPGGEDPEPATGGDRAPETDPDARFAARDRRRALLGGAYAGTT